MYTRCFPPDLKIPPGFAVCSHLGLIHKGSHFPLSLILTCVGCNSCSGTADCCCPSTALCAWLPSASPCLWPSACSHRCLRYCINCRVNYLSAADSRPDGSGSSWNKFKLHMHHLTRAAPAHELVVTSYSRCLLPFLIKKSKWFSGFKDRKGSFQFHMFLCRLRCLALSRRSPWQQIARWWPTTRVYDGCCGVREHRG